MLFCFYLDAAENGMSLVIVITWYSLFKVRVHYYRSTLHLNLHTSIKIQLQINTVS